MILLNLRYRTLKHFILVFFLKFLIVDGCLIDAYAVSKIPQRSFFSTQLPWSLEVGFGYGIYQNMWRDDGQAVLARIGIAKELVKVDSLLAGLEIGVQSGTSGRVEAPESIIIAMGYLPIDTTFKPSLDVLATCRFYPSVSLPLFALFKAGANVRHWQFTRASIMNLTQVYPEFQVGLGYDITRLMRLSFSYQQVVGNNPNIHLINEEGDARVDNIPAENGLLIGLSIIFDSSLIR